MASALSAPELTSVLKRMKEERAKLSKYEYMDDAYVESAIGLMKLIPTRDGKERTAADRHDILLYLNRWVRLERDGTDLSNELHENCSCDNCVALVIMSNIKNLEEDKRRGALALALAKAQAELEGAKKNGANPAFRSKYAKLDGVWEAWQEVGPKNGLSVVQLVEDAGEGRQGVILRTILLHQDGGFLEAKSYWPAVKNDAQGFGSALTYARRYSLMALTGICPVDDDDGNAAVKSVAASKKEDVERFEAGLTKYWDDKTRLLAILAEANKAGLTSIAERAHKRIQEL